MQLAIKAGRMHEPRARLGVSEATADMLVKGTKKHDAVALAKAIDFVGGTIARRRDVRGDARVVQRARAQHGDLPRAAARDDHAADVPRRRARQGQASRWSARSASGSTTPGSSPSAHVQNLLWGNDHVRGWINSEQSVAAIRRDDLVAWHKTWFVAEQRDPRRHRRRRRARSSRATSSARSAAGRRRAVPPAPTYKEPGLSGSRIRLVDKPGQTQTHIRIAQFGIKHDDPRFFDTLVWNYALGGGAFSSRLMKVVRVEGGKTYGASSSFDRNLDKGSFVAQTFTRNAEAVATTKLDARRDRRRWRRTARRRTRSTAAIANIAGGYGLRFQAAADSARALIGAELHGFGNEYLANFPLAVGKVDVAAAKRAAARSSIPRTYVIVMVGDAKDLEPQLKKAGWRYEKVAFTRSDRAGRRARRARRSMPKALAAAQQADRRGARREGRQGQARARSRRSR